MTGCGGCFDYTRTSGRINAIVIDPTTTTNGSIVAYAASVGGGVWKTTNCCSDTTTWSVTTDDPLIAAISIDTLAIDPNDHNTIYAGTGDLNYGSFSMGSQGILKSTDGGAHWTTLGADVFGPAYAEPAGQFPQYDAVGKVRVDPNNSQQRRRGHEEGPLHLLQRRPELDRPVHDQLVHGHAAGHHRPRAHEHGRRRHAHPRRRRRARLRDDRAVRPRPERRERPLHGDDAVERLPETSRSSRGNDNGFVFGNQVTGSAVYDGRADERRQRRRLT